MLFCGLRYTKRVPKARVSWFLELRIDRCNEKSSNGKIKMGTHFFFFLEKSVRPSFGMTPTQAIRDLSCNLTHVRIALPWEVVRVLSSLRLPSCMSGCEGFLWGQANRKVQAFCLRGVSTPKPPKPLLRKVHYGARHGILTQLQSYSVWTSSSPGNMEGLVRNDIP